MALTYTLIASNTLSSSAASVTFSSIPATYTDLEIRYSARSNEVDTTTVLAVTFNNSSATNYSVTRLRGSSSGAGSGFQSNVSYLYYGLFNGANTTSNTFTNGAIYIPNYTSSANKPSSSFSVLEVNNTTDYFIDINAGLRSVTDAITSITLTSTPDQFVSGSTFWLYGISKN